MTIDAARSHTARKAAGSAFVAVAALVLLTANAAAQAPPQEPAAATDAAPADQGAPAADGGQAAGSPITNLVAANQGNLKKISPELIALVTANPALAAGLIEAAKQYPAEAQQLAQLLSTIQSAMKTTDPDGAKVIAALVASAPAPFQAAYAVALAGPGQSGGGGGAPATGGGTASGGGAAGGGTSGGGGSGGGGGTGGGSSSGGLGFGSSFGGSIGNASGGGGGGTSSIGGGSTNNGSETGAPGGGNDGGGPSGNGGGGNALTLSQVFTQLFTDYAVDPGSVSSSDITTFGQQLKVHGVDPANLTTNQYDGLLEIGSNFVENPNSVSPEALTTLLMLGNVTPGQVTHNQVSALLVSWGMNPSSPYLDSSAAHLMLAGFSDGGPQSPEKIMARLAVFGVNLQGSLSTTTIEQLQQAMAAAGYSVPLADMKIELTVNNISLANYGPGQGDNNGNPPNNGGGQSNGGNPINYTLNQLATQLLINNSVDPHSVTAEQLAGWRQWLTNNGRNPDELNQAQYTELLGQAQSLVDLGIDAGQLVTFTGSQIQALDHTVDWLEAHNIESGNVDAGEKSTLLILAGLKSGHVTTGELSELLALAGLGGTATKPADQLKALLSLSGLTPGQVTPDQLAGFLGKVGVMLPGPLSTMTLSQFKMLVRAAGINVTDQELKKLLLVAGIEVSVFKASCSGVVSRSTPCG